MLPATATNTRAGLCSRGLTPWLGRRPAVCAGGARSLSTVRAPAFRTRSAACRMQQRQLITHRMEPSLGAAARALWQQQVGFGDKIKRTLAEAQDVVKRGLREEGFCVLTPVLGRTLCANMRLEATDLFRGGQFGRSYTVSGNRMVEKHNVFALELDGHEWEVAPSLLTYTKDILTYGPELINALFPAAKLSPTAYATELAVSTGGGSRSPKHLDNTGLPDNRKLTVLYYLNSHWDQGNGGHLRLHKRHGRPKDITPEGDTLVLFWSDEMVHEVLPSFDQAEAAQRWVFTLWLLTEDPLAITHPPQRMNGHSSHTAYRGGMNGHSHGHTHGQGMLR